MQVLQITSMEQLKLMVLILNKIYLFRLSCISEEVQEVEFVIHMYLLFLR